MRRLLTWRWILVHLTAVVLVVAFLLLCWWQFDRARGGNLLSYGYAIEWPAFAIFVIYVWVKEVRTARQRAGSDASAPAPRPVIRASARPERAGAAYDDSGDEELAAYNRYLAWLNANPGATPAQYPG